jgi:hypothetical protein
LTIVNLEFWAFFPYPFLWIYSSGGEYTPIFFITTLFKIFLVISPPPEEKLQR